MADIERNGARTGGCLCGAVRYSLTGDKTGIDACHCDMCRRWNGGIGFGLSLSEKVVTWQGADSIRRYRSSDWAERGFCGVCGSHLFYRLTDPEQDHLSLLPGTLDDQDGLSLDLEIFADRGPEAYALTGAHKKMTAAETLAMFADYDV